MTALSAFQPMTPRLLKSTHGFTSLTTPDGYNPKLRKGRAQGYSSLILHLAPASLSGYNVCQWASDGCRTACLNTAGRGGIVKHGETTNAVQTARIARTRWFFEDRGAFMAQLAHEIETHCRRARNNGLTPVVRLNGTSDIPWERIKMPDGRTVFEAFPDVQFYDYSKSIGRAYSFAAGKLPVNYHLTFSRSESNDADVRSALWGGVSVAVVFAGALPMTYHGAPVIAGDHDDLRFLDRRGSVVGLKAKGRAKRDTSGFVVAPDAMVVPEPAITRRVMLTLPMLGETVA